METKATNYCRRSLWAFRSHSGTVAQDTRAPQSSHYGFLHIGARVWHAGQNAQRSHPVYGQRLWRVIQ